MIAAMKSTGTNLLMHLILSSYLSSLFTDLVDNAQRRLCTSSPNRPARTRVRAWRPRSSPRTGPFPAILRGSRCQARAWHRGELAAAGLRISALLLRERAPLLALQRDEPGVAPAFQAGELALQLPVALQTLGRKRAGADRLAYGAPRLRLVAAVVEAAFGLELGDVVEGLGQPVRALPELELAEPRRVDHEPAVRQRQQLAVSGRVPAAAVLSDLLRLELLAPEQPVDQARLADARGSEQDDGAARGQMGPKLVDPLAGHGADGVDGDAERDSLDLGDEQGALFDRAQVGLVQNNRGLGAAFPRGRQVALDPPDVQVAVERGYEEDRVDVGGEHLLLRLAEVHLAGDLRPPRQHGLDRRLAAGSRLERDPIADRGQDEDLPQGEP